jgi:hypothetical protein
VPRLFAALALGRADGRYTRMLRAIARLDLLILDDWGPELSIGKCEQDPSLRRDCRRAFDLD